MQIPLKRLSVPPLLIGLTGGSAVLLFLASSLRHLLFQSAGWDLGIFDQGLYLLSQGFPPYSTLREIHLLGDHAAWILYLIALLYKLYPSVYWLFAIQALALALGALPTFALARQAQLPDQTAVTLVLVYLLYPLVFNANLFDFHPETIAVPLLLTAIWAARSRDWAVFIPCVLLTLGCKAVLGLTVAALGIWLLVWERRRGYGLVAIAAGTLWFAIATQVIIPVFSGRQPAGVSLYGYLGNSMSEVIANVFLKPHLVLGQLLSLGTVEYLALLLGPVLWGLSIPALVPLFPALPTLALNLLSSEPQQHNLTQHYSLPILPFLILAIITTLQVQHDRGVQSWWWRFSGGDAARRSAILGWAIAAFLLLAKYGYFGSLYLQSLDTWQASRTAIAQVTTADPVLTTSNFAPHLTHRPLIRQTQAASPPADLGEFHYGLLNVKHPGWLSSPAFAQALVDRFQADDRFTQIYAADGVYLFQYVAQNPSVRINLGGSELGDNP
ncbi:DUF2079 domain-containing protein [Trichothermofontia sp.]